MNYSEKYGVKKAKSVSDESVLYGETSKAAMWGMVIGAVVLIIALVFGFVSFHNIYNQ